MSQPRALFVGLCTLDFEYIVARFPARDEKVVAVDQIVAAGGPATNAAKTFAAIGGAATLATVTGSPSGFRSQLRELVTDWGVQMLQVGSGSAEVTVSSIIVSRDTGERAVISVNDRGREVAAIPSLPVADLSAVLVDGHHMSLALAAAQQAKEAGVQVVFDGGSWKPGTDALLSYVDWAICSERFTPPGVSDGHDAVLGYLAERGVRGAAITLGSAGGVFYAEQTRGRFASCAPAAVVDSLGAGDVFHGAACYHLSNGVPFDASLRAAADAAGASCGYVGIDRWLSQVRKPDA